MNPVELQCIYLVSESTLELRLNHAVRSVMISGPATFQVLSNLFKKKLSVIILENGLRYSVALPVLLTTVAEYQLFLTSVVCFR